MATRLAHRLAARVFGFLASIFLVGPSAAADRTWTNAAGGNWNVAASWGGTIPSSTDNAYLNALSGAYTVNANDTFTPQTAANFTIAGGNVTLNQTGTLTVGGAFALNAGNYILAGGTATINGPLTVASGASANWTGGTLTGTGTLNGLMTASGGAKTVAGTGFQIGGTLRWTSGSINTPFGGVPVTLTNTTNGTIDFTADGTPFLIDTASPGTLANLGVLRKSGGVADATYIGWAVTFFNQSTVDTTVGVLNFNGGGTLRNGTTTFSGAGTANLNLGTFTIPTGETFVATGSGGANLRWTGGTLTADTAGAGILSGFLVAAGGAKTISNTTLQIGGTLRWTSGSIFTPFGGVPVAVTNNPAGLIDITADGAPFAINTASPGTVINQGTLRKSGGNLSSSDIGWAVQFRNGSTVDVQTGVLNFNNGGTLNNGTTTTSGNGVANLNQGTFTIPSGDTFTAAGTGSANLRWTGGTLTADPSGTGILGGVLVAAGGAKTISNTTLQIGGTLRWTAGTINTPFGGVPVSFAVNPTGTIDLQADGSSFIIDTASPGTIFNQGMLKKSVGTATATTIGWNVTNSGTLTAVTGTLNLTGTNTNTGVVTTGPSAAIGGNITTNSGGRVQGPGGSNAVYNGNLTFNSGGTLAPGTTTAGNQYGGIVINGNLAMNSGSTLDFHAKNTQPLVDYDQVTVNGTVTLNSVTLTSSFGTFVPLPADRYFLVVNDGTDPVVGTFAGLPDGATVTVGTYAGKISYFGDFATNATTGGNDIVIYNFSVVPEPTGILAITAVFVAVLPVFLRGGVQRLAARTAIGASGRSSNVDPDHFLGVGQNSRTVLPTRRP